MQFPLRSELAVIPITPMAKIQLKAKIKWFLEQKQNMKDFLWDDQVCLLLLACFLFMDIPEEPQCLLFYKQEATYHTRWLATASDFIQLFLFETSNLADDKLI